MQFSATEDSGGMALAITAATFHRGVILSEAKDLAKFERASELREVPRSEPD
jgi:hypothetical protein